MRFLLKALLRIAVKTLIVLIVINLSIILISGSEFHSLKELISISSVQERIGYLLNFGRFTYHKFTGAFCDWVNEFRQETHSDRS